ncbi:MULTISPECIES: hypothetical protein [unclassified Imperialibacter]|uniref:hypothetical protein n=1 Tax=unclassified Imperialibacter TaxID=2629706 RepID=UPI00125A9462|nr:MULTISPECIES: hypothetical protein [unclassified Imperialibacter]CAD5257858.1 conserved membrane hypothetical protein [Imperialibacter sp. 75]CAD5260863.1 conserved membrane hypothetical protein [Imperialibacter sp. 89]VVT25283.1 conserved membrane hypothetical protein [Imperialibacter sp. EC-SDR9]
MNEISTKSNGKTLKWFIASALLTGLGMWVVGGLYHNLILPTVNKDMHPHHEGLGTTLIAYFILAFLMTYIYSTTEGKNSWAKGIRHGCIIGVLWVFPHGLAMAATHETSILYEVKNTIYHVVEQGVGGAIIFYVSRYFMKMQVRVRK